MSHCTTSLGCTKLLKLSRNALRLPAKRAGRNTISLLLATLVALLFALTRDDLAQHHHTVAVHESNAGKTLAILEAVTDQRLLRLEADLRHLVRLQGMGVLHLLARQSPCPFSTSRWRRGMRRDRNA